MKRTDFSGQRPIAEVSGSAGIIFGAGHTLSRLELLRLARTSNTTRKATEGDNLLVFLHVAEVGVCLGQLKTCVPATFRSST